MGLKKTELSFRFTTTKCLDLNAAVLYLAVSLTTRPTPTGYRLVLTEQKGEMFWVPFCTYSQSVSMPDFVLFIILVLTCLCPKIILHWIFKMLFWPRFFGCIKWLDLALDDHSAFQINTKLAKYFAVTILRSLVSKCILCNVAPSTNHCSIGHIIEAKLKAGTIKDIYDKSQSILQNREEQSLIMTNHWSIGHILWKSFTQFTNQTKW